MPNKIGQNTPLIVLRKISSTEPSFFVDVWGCASCGYLELRGFHAAKCSCGGIMVSKLLKRGRSLNG